MKHLEMNLSWMKVALNPITDVLVRDRRGDTDAEEEPKDHCDLKELHQNVQGPPVHEALYSNKLVCF